MAWLRVNAADKSIEPTGRFWLMKHFTNLTPKKSEVTASSSDRPDVLISTFVKGNSVVVHVLNRGPACTGSFTGLPPGKWRSVTTTEIDGWLPRRPASTWAKLPGAATGPQPDHARPGRMKFSGECRSRFPAAMFGEVTAQSRSLHPPESRRRSGNLKELFYPRRCSSALEYIRYNDHAVPTPLLSARRRRPFAARCYLGSVGVPAA